MPIRDIECLLRVSITNEHRVSESSVYQGCIQEIFGVPYPIDLIPIPMGDVCVILGMDWLSCYGAMIDYEVQRVIVQTPGGGEMVIYGEGTRMGSGFCSATRA